MTLATGLVAAQGALTADPAFRTAYYNRAVLVIRAGRTAAARADIEAFVRFGGEAPAAVLTLVGLATKPCATGPDLPALNPPPCTA